MNVSIRKRVPFKFADGTGLVDDDHRILDEQEQDALIQKLKVDNQSSNSQSLFVLQVVLFFAVLLQCISLSSNPLLAIFPPTLPETTLEIPLPVLFTFLNIFLHFNLCFLVFPTLARSLTASFGAILRPFSFQMTYALSAVPLTLSMFLRRPWQSTVWWSMTILVVFTVQTVIQSINEGNQSVSELETMRYVSRGA